MNRDLVASPDFSKENRMIEVGKIQNLVIDRISKIGPYLVDPQDKKEKKDSVLMPGKELPKGAAVGDTLSVFVYRDSGDRPIATLRRPKILMGELAPLKVVAITKVGAFMDWGLEKDVLLPYSEQITKVQIGREYLVELYLDKSGRLCATMKVYPKLENETPYKAGDWVEGYIYQINPEMGAFVAVDLKYHGLVPLKEMISADVHCGDSVKARVTQIRKDGKLALSPNRKAYKEIPQDARVIYDKLMAAGGSLPYNDKTPPAIIAKEFHMSKASFKRAIGNLLKTKKIRITSRGITLSESRH